MTGLSTNSRDSKHQLAGRRIWLVDQRIEYTMRWHAHYHTEGTGHLYQGRFKTFPIEADDHLLTVLRYVERNPLRASLCEQAEDWRFGSLWRRKHGTPEQQHVLCEWPIARPRQWAAHVNRPQSEADLTAVRNSVRKGTPYRSGRFVTQSAVRLQLEHTLRPRGRPRKRPAEKGTQLIYCWGSV